MAMPHDGDDVKKLVTVFTDLILTLRHVTHLQGLSFTTKFSANAALRNLDEARRCTGDYFPFVFRKSRYIQVSQQARYLK